MADFRIAVGETTPAFQRTLKSDNVAVDLTGATVTFSLIKHGLAYIDNAATTAVTPASGIVKYVWQAGDLTDTGFFTATFKVVYPSTAIEYFEFTIEVIDGAGIVAPVTPPALDFATQVELDAHINDTTAAHAATAISNTPAGSIAATTVQAAIDELDTEKVGTGDSRLTDSRTPTGTAGGVLGGTYPNPSFAVDMATQAEINSVAQFIRRNQSALGGTPVATCGTWPQAVTGGTTLDNNCRKRHKALTAFSNVRLVYANAYLHEGTAVPNNITIRAGVETGSNSYPVYFRGTRSVTIEPGAVVISDPIYVPVAAGDYFWTRTWVGGMVSGDKHPYDSIDTLVSAYGEGSDLTVGVAKSDLTLSTGATGLTNTVGYSPVAVIGSPGSLVPASLVGVIGDSIGVGVGDTTASVTGRGCLRRAMNETVSYVIGAASGLTILGSNGWYGSTAGTRRIRNSLFAGATHILCELGINDINRSTPQTFSAIQTALLAMWTEWANLGIKVYQTTLTPVTTSTDNWATTTNQTIKATGFNETTRTSLNDWIRTTPSPLTGYFDVADVVETARNSGIWKVGYVYVADAQGLHPSTVGHQAIAAAIDPSLFVI